MKLSVFTVATPDLTPEELAAASAAAGLDGIEWRYTEVPEARRNEKPSYWGNNLCTLSPLAGPGEIDRFKEAAEAQGLKTLGLMAYLRLGDLEGTEKLLSAAKRMSAPFVRLPVPGYDRSTPYPELQERGQDYLREAADLCRQYGVKGLLETHHGTIAASASAALRLAERFDPDHIGVLYDPGNMVYEGYENYRMGLELLGPYLAHVHMKNAGWMPPSGDPEGEWQAGWRPMSQGMVPWRRVVEDLRSVGYDGYIGVEDFSGQYGSAEMLKAFAAYMRSL